MYSVVLATMLAAGGWKILKALLHHEAAPNWTLLAIGCVVSAIVSFAAVKWLLRFVQTHTFVGFGWYRVVFGVMLLIALLR